MTPIPIPTAHVIRFDPHIGVWSAACIAASTARSNDVPVVFVRDGVLAVVMPGDTAQAVSDAWLQDRGAAT